LDIARAIIAVFQAPAEAIHNEVFNVGDTSHNYRVREIAEMIRTQQIDPQFSGRMRLGFNDLLAENLE
jgi:nucleoside-diphosphate-sugar epimerase